MWSTMVRTTSICDMFQRAKFRSETTPSWSSSLFLDLPETRVSPCASYFKLNSPCPHKMNLSTLSVLMEVMVIIVSTWSYWGCCWWRHSETKRWYLCGSAESTWDLPKLAELIGSGPPVGGWSVGQDQQCWIDGRAFRCTCLSAIFGISWQP